VPLVSFAELMEAAAAGSYAVGYFESWNLESLLAVADAAVATSSPVVVGFSGIYLPRTEGMQLERLRLYASVAANVCRGLPVPACALFNESPHMDWVLEASKTGFSVVMYTDEELPYEEQRTRVRGLVREAHRMNVAVEAEILSVPGVSESLSDIPGDLRMTDPGVAREFVDFTGVDALAVNVGQAHLHGKRRVQLDLDRLAKLSEQVRIPLVLHGATSIDREHISSAIQLGIRKVNIGSALKRVYFETLRSTCERIDAGYNPYEVVGSGCKLDVLGAARQAMKETVTEWMLLLGSAGKAEICKVKIV
jgi:fructose-bisphosphate aldolase, class II